jgi:hypothetical protein
MKNNDTKKIFLLISSIVFIIFLFTSDGHRYTMDEDLGAQMALGMVTFEPHPDYVQGESKNFFQNELKNQNPYHRGLFCSNGITCYPTSVFYSITETPFIILNHYFHIITTDTLIFSTDNFADAHYIFWRNSENVDFVFMELFFGPFFSALSVGIFFLICLEHNFTRKNSIILSFLLAFSTIIWAYSNTSLNVLPACSFLLLGYLFFKKFHRLDQNKFLLFSSASLGFSFLIRTDIILFIIPLWLFLLGNILKRNSKINSLLFYSAPLLFSYFVNKIIFSLKYIQSDEAIDAAGNTSSVTSNLIGEFSSFIFSSNITHIFIATFGLLFAPGVGLFIFSPILITVFFSFPDLYRKNKSECLLFLSFFISTLFYHADLQHWHGLVAWGTRYLIPLIPFLIIPLGTSLEKRNKKFMFLIIFIFGSLGVLFNFAYVVQDVSWFVWSTPGSTVGLFALGLPHIGQFDLWINDVVIWTFQYSQLTHSILLMVEGLQHDIYLLHLLGIPVYISVLTLFLSSLFYFLRYILKQKTILNKNFENIT